MPPPELAADAPVAFFAQPVEIALGVAIRVNGHASRGDGVHGLLSESGRLARVFAHTHEPLIRQVGFDRRLAAVGVIETHEVRVDPFEQVECLQVLDDPLAHAQAIDAGVFAGIFVVGSVRIEQVDHRQALSQTGLIIVGIMAGSDLDDAGAEGRVDQERDRR